VGWAGFFAVSFEETSIAGVPWAAAFGVGLAMTLGVAWILFHVSVLRPIRLALKETQSILGQLGSDGGTLPNEVVALQDNVHKVQRLVLDAEAQVKALALDRLADPILDQELEGELGKGIFRISHFLRGVSERLFIVARGEPGLLVCSQGELARSANNTISKLTELRRDYGALEQGLMVGPHLVAFGNVHGQLEFLSQALQKHVGISGSVNMRALVDPASQILLQTALRMVSETGLWQGELLLITPPTSGNGPSSMATECFCKVLTRDDGGEPAKLGWYFQDLSGVLSVEQLKERTAGLIHQARKGALGELALGIAHEISNPLTVVTARAGLIKGWVRKGSMDLKMLDSAVDQIERMALKIHRIIQGLKSLNADSGGCASFAQVSLAEIIRETVELCRSRMEHDEIDIQVEDMPQSVKFECQPEQIFQILLNLLNNSFDAVRGNTEKWIRIAAFFRGDAVEVWVTDSGPPIPTHLREKVLQPFFTTKETGTGLGLSISQKIAKLHGGSLFLDAGCVNTRFILRLPIRQVPSERRAA